MSAGTGAGVNQGAGSALRTVAELDAVVPASILTTNVLGAALACYQHGLRLRVAKSGNWAHFSPPLAIDVPEPVVGLHPDRRIGFAYWIDAEVVVATNNYDHAAHPADVPVPPIGKIEKNLVSAAVMECLKGGLTLKIVANGRERYPTAAEYDRTVDKIVKPAEPKNPVPIGSVVGVILVPLPTDEKLARINKVLTALYALQMLGFLAWFAAKAWRW